MGVQREKYEGFAKTNGYLNLGESDVDLDLELGDQEKIEAGRAQTEALAAIDEIEEQLSDYKTDCKAKVERYQEQIRVTRRMLHTGKKTVTRRLPSFIDRRNNRIWIDMATGEQVLSRPATDNEKQGVLA